MGDRAFITWFGDQHTSGIGIEGMTEDIEQEIALAYKADAECLIVLRFGSSAFHTPAFEIQYAVEAGSVQGMYVGIHRPNLQKTI
jgi:hypothetical protein